MVEATARRGDPDQNSSAACHPIPFGSLNLDCYLCKLYFWTQLALIAASVFAVGSLVSFRCYLQHLVPQLDLTFMCTQRAAYWFDFYLYITVLSKGIVIYVVSARLHLFIKEKSNRILAAGYRPGRYAQCALALHYYLAWALPFLFGFRVFWEFCGGLLFFDTMACKNDAAAANYASQLHDLVTAPEATTADSQFYTSVKAAWMVLVVVRLVVCAGLVLAARLSVPTRLMSPGSLHRRVLDNFRQSRSPMLISAVPAYRLDSHQPQNQPPHMPCDHRQRGLRPLQLNFLVQFKYRDLFQICEEHGRRHSQDKQQQAEAELQTSHDAAQQVAHPARPTDQQLSADGVVLSLRQPSPEPPSQFMEGAPSASSSSLVIEEIRPATGSSQSLYSIERSYFIFPEDAAPAKAALQLDAPGNTDASVLRGTLERAQPAPKANEVTNKASESSGQDNHGPQQTATVGSDSNRSSPSSFGDLSGQIIQSTLLSSTLSNLSDSHHQQPEFSGGHETDRHRSADSGEQSAAAGHSQRCNYIYRHKSLYTVLLICLSVLVFLSDLTALPECCHTGSMTFRSLNAYLNTAIYRIISFRIRCICYMKQCQDFIKRQAARCFPRRKELQSSETQRHREKMRQNQKQLHLLLQQLVNKLDILCCICYCEYDPDDTLILIPCPYKHYCHKQCIIAWLRRHETCPLCRHNIAYETTQATMDVLG